MKRMLAAVAGASLLLVLGGCGDDDDKVDSLGGVGDAAGAAGGTSLAGSADADKPDADLGDAAQNGSGGEEGVPEVVEPRAGMDNVRPVTWDKAEVLSPRNLRITFYGGVEPCDVLDSVKVNYGAKNVTVSLFSGSDPAKPDSVCIEIAKLKAVEVKLTEDIEDRKVVDGAPDASTSSNAGSGTSVDTGAGEAAAGKVRGDAPAVALKPEAGQANVQQITWDKVEMLDGNIARVYFMTGVEPCSVLDSVKVIYAKEIIRIALFTGADPAQKDAACPAIARLAYTDIKLKEPVGNREVVDDYQTD